MDGDITPECEETPRTAAKINYHRGVGQRLTIYTGGFIPGTIAPAQYDKWL